MRLGAWSGTVEQTWALILALSRRIIPEYESVRQGGWQVSTATGLSGKTLGLVGVGRLGSTVAKVSRLAPSTCGSKADHQTWSMQVAQAFGMHVIGWSPHLTPSRAAAAGVSLAPSLNALLTTADVVSLHLVFAPSTKGIIGSRELALLKKTAFLINTSRGPLIDEEALLEVIKAGGIAGVGLDVYGEEPLPRDAEIRRQKNVVLSPHMGKSDSGASREVEGGRSGGEAVLIDWSGEQGTWTTRLTRLCGPRRSRTSRRYWKAILSGCWRPTRHREHTNGPHRRALSTDSCSGDMAARWEIVEDIKAIGTCSRTHTTVQRVSVMAGTSREDPAEVIPRAIGGAAMRAMSSRHDRLSRARKSSTVEPRSAHDSLRHPAYSETHQHAARRSTKQRAESSQQAPSRTRARALSAALLSRPSAMYTAAEAIEYGLSFARGLKERYDNLGYQGKVSRLAPSLVPLGR